MGALLICGADAQATDYYLDAQKGDDARAGTAPAAAWRTLERANRADLVAGDSLLLAGGQTFAGTLSLDNRSGDARQPIVVKSSGAGRAIIDGGQGDGVSLNGCAWVAVENLSVVGAGRKAGNNGRGIWLNRTRNVEVRDCGVSGFRLAGVELWGDQSTRLTGVNAVDNGGAGISVLSGWGDMPRTRDLEIRDCVVANNAGDPRKLTEHTGSGIIVGGADGVLIDGCTATNNGWDMPGTQGGGPAGIWAWNSDRVTIQNCLSYGNRSNAGDGDGFDFDGAVTNSVMQYNLSYDNDGPGFLLWQYEGAGPWHSNIVRHNVSYNDGRKSFKSSLAISLDKQSEKRAALVANNTFINDLYNVASYTDGPRVEYQNNIFYAGTAVIVGTVFPGARYRNNLYWAKSIVQPWELFADYPKDGVQLKTLDDWIRASGQETEDGQTTARFADPQLTMPTRLEDLPREAAELAAMRYFRPNADAATASLGALSAQEPFVAPRD